MSEQESNQKQSFIERLKDKWKVKSTLQVIIILVVFSITGSLAVFIGKPILAFFDVTKDNYSTFLYYTFRILIIFPIYQVMLLVVGTLLGQFEFFWNFQKKTVGRLFRR